MGIFPGYGIQAGMEACYDHMKNLKCELERLHTENKSLNAKVESMEQLQSEMKDELKERQNVTKSLTDTIDQLVNTILCYSWFSSQFLNWLSSIYTLFYFVLNLYENSSFFLLDLLISS